MTVDRPLTQERILIMSSRFTLVLAACALFGVTQPCPINAVADDQVRRNHTIQYFAYPDYVFDRLRKESPETYETYADISPGRWIHMKIAVAAGRAQLYLDNKERPALLVNDLKLGADQRGGVGIWIESGTIAHFRNLRVTHAR